MFSKLLCASVVAVALAQEMPGIETRDGSVVFLAPNEGAFVRDATYQSSQTELSGMNVALQGTVQGLSNRVDTIKTSAEAIKGGVATSSEAIETTADINKALRSSSKDIETMNENVHVALAGATAEGNLVINATVMDLEGNLEAAFAALKVELRKQKAALDTNVKGAIEVMKDEAIARTATAVLLNAEVDAHEDCTAGGRVWNQKTGKCMLPDVDAAKLLPKVWHQHFAGDDGRDNGLLNGRAVAFDKKNDDTYIRVVYYDNLRVHGHLAHGQWNVLICDAAGNGCDYCAEPGRLNLWRWSRHQGNWWMNDHVGHTLTGICKKSNNRDLRKGKYQLRVRLENNRYDMYTGHSTEQCNFMVDEVIKYD